MPHTIPPASPLSDLEMAHIGRTVIHEIPDAIIYIDRNNVIRFWNAGATRIFGFSTSEAIGQSLDIIIPERLRKRHADGFQHMMDTGQRRHKPEELLSVPALTKSGETLSIQFTVAPVMAEDQTVVGIVAVLRDVTALFRELKLLRSRT